MKRAPRGPVAGTIMPESGETAAPTAPPDAPDASDDVTLPWEADRGAGANVDDSAAMNAPPEPGPMIIDDTPDFDDSEPDASAPAIGNGETLSITTDEHGQTTFAEVDIDPDADDVEADEPVGALQFRSSEEALTTAQALQDRATDLRALAKKARELSRNREANSIDQEAAHIGEALLPQLRPQLTIPFNSGETLLNALARSVGQTVRSATVRAVNATLQRHEGETADDVTARRKELLENFETVVGFIAEHTAAAVLPFIEETAERAYAAGMAARNNTPHTLALHAVQMCAAKGEGD